jgi:hypothetical protein
MPDDVLTKLQELAAIPELTKGFLSQQDCIAWANKVIPFLSFNKKVQDSFGAYQTNINTIGLSADLQRTSLNQMVSILHFAISEIQEIERTKPKAISDELLGYADVFESICNRFIEGNRNLHLATNDEAFFRQKLFEVISVIKESLGEKNLYTGNMISAVNAGSGQFGPSLHCVQSVRGLILAAQKEVKRKELSKEEKQEADMISSNDSKAIDLSSSKIENLPLRDLIKLLSIPKLVGLGTFLFALLATSFYFGYNVRTWQTDKALYDLNKENRELKERLDKLLRQQPANQQVDSDAEKGSRPGHP